MDSETIDPVSIIDFDKAGGLVTAIAQDDATGEVLMVAYMNEESLRRTLEIGESRLLESKPPENIGTRVKSRGTCRAEGLYVDCDGDALVLRVEQVGGAACHTGKRNCFFRRIDEGSITDVGVQVFDPKEVYGK